MTLIKKTVVLVKDKTMGYITIIKLGDTAGAKVVLNEPVKERLWLALKIGNNPQTALSFSETQAEFSLVMDFNSSDSIGAAIMDEKGAIYAYGGRRDIVSLSALKASITAALTEKPEKQTTFIAPEENDNVVLAAAEPDTSGGYDSKNPLQDDALRQNKDSLEGKITDSKHPLQDDALSQNKDSLEGKITDSKHPLSGKHAPEIKYTQKDEPEIEIRSPDSTARNPFDVPKGENFYQSVRSRLNDIMTINPREERLERLIPDSQWVRVKYDREDYYVVGILTDEGVTTHIAYGVPGRKEVKPPREAEEFCDFLPFDGPNNGFWLMFQNARDGSMVKN